MGRAPVSCTEVPSTLRALSRLLVRTHLASPGSWPSACHGVLKRSPLRRSPPRSPLPRTSPPASARCCQAPCVFRPRGLSPPRRFSPPERSQACCILLPTLGFTGFWPRAVRPRAVTCSRASVSGFPSDAIALQSLPRSCSRAARHRGPSAPSPFADTAADADLEAFLHTSVRCAPFALPRGWPDALLGFPFLELRADRLVRSGCRSRDLPVTPRPRRVAPSPATEVTGSEDVVPARPRRPPVVVDPKVSTPHTRPLACPACLYEPPLRPRPRRVLTAAGSVVFAASPHPRGCVSP
jgi:hypothetical protein